MAKHIIDQEIQNLDTPWWREEDGHEYGYSGSRIENFIKSQLASLSESITSVIGKMVVSPRREDEQDGNFHLRAFKSDATYNQWLVAVDKSIPAIADLVLVDLVLPDTHTSTGVRNSCVLVRNSDASIAVDEARATMTLTYVWNQIDNVSGNVLHMDETATLNFSVRMQNSYGQWGPWDEGRAFTDTIESGETKAVDLSRILLSDGTYQVRVFATGVASSLGGSGVVTAPVTMTIMYSDISISYRGNTATPFVGNSISPAFSISGSVSKQLHLKINNIDNFKSLGNNAYVENLYSEGWNASLFNLSQRGVYSAEAWVTFGENYANSTEHIYFQIIYVPSSETSGTPILAVSDVKSSITNWTRVNIFKFGVYNPSAARTSVRIRAYDIDTSEVYLDDTYQCENNTDYVYSKNLSIEPSSEHNLLNVRVQFLDENNQAFDNVVSLTIDNTDNFSATRGSTVTINPEKQLIQVGETAYPLSAVLRDLSDTRSGWTTTPMVDSTGETVHVPVLRIASGNSIEIPYEMFDSLTGTGGANDLSAEFDVRISNIVDDAHPVINVSGDYGESYTGIRVYPTRAVLLSRDNQNADVADVNFQEDAREHLVFNIINNLRNEGISYVRIFINSKMNREYVYRAQQNQFIPVSGGNGNIRIGSDDADIDIFFTRIYKAELGSQQIQNNFMSNMPTIADKRSFKHFNSIFNGTSISYDSCNNLGLNTILRIIPSGGHYPSRQQPGKQTDVRIVVKMYKTRGDASSLDTAHSGTFYGMTCKGQGTSAMGYYWWNISDGFVDDEEISAEAYASGDPSMYEHGGRYFRKRSYFNSDDGTSQVFSSEYEIEDGRGGITKLVGKANYASAMQSHKLGGVWMYDELWQRLVNNGAGGRPVLPCHASCYQKPFLAFYKIEGKDTAPVFCGFNTWGSAKGDKKTFGYNKSSSPGYMCISGADNGSKSALFQMPWIVSKGPDGIWSGNIFPASVTLNTGSVKNGYCYMNNGSPVLSWEVEIGQKYGDGESVGRIADEAKGGTETTLMTVFSDFANFIFSSSPLLLPWNGTAASLIAASADLRKDHQYWISANNADRYKVYYYNPATNLFEQVADMISGWGDDGRANDYSPMTILDQLSGISIPVSTIGGAVVKPIEDALSGESDPMIKNKHLIAARVAYFKSHAPFYLDVLDVLFHQCFVKLECGTDNRTKNVYPWIDPGIDKLVRFKQDDVDTIHKTDNQGQQTKPYFILEHTKNAGNANYWNGENNVLFTLIEMAYDSEMRDMMRNMFAEMSAICGDVYKYYHKRFFWVQEYFPAVSYNETSRLLYETAKVKYDAGTVILSQDPISQSIGDQLECEIQFVKQRVPMLMSWCRYEQDQGMGALTFRSVSRVNGSAPHYLIEFTAYQYIYPRVSVGGATYDLEYYDASNGQWVVWGSDPYLCSPGETVRFEVDTDSNTQLTIPWMNYAKSIGNIGMFPIMESGTLSIQGRRLREFNCYVEDGSVAEFRTPGISISDTCRNLEVVNLGNISSLIGDFTANLERCRSLNLKGTRYSTVSIPETSALVNAKLPGTLQELILTNQPNLRDLQLEGYGQLRTVRIDCAKVNNLNSQHLVKEILDNVSGILSVTIDNAAWTDMTAEDLVKIARLNGRINGVVSLTSDSMTPEQKLIIANAFGDIDDIGNGLVVNYLNRIFISSTANMVAYGDSSGVILVAKSLKRNVVFSKSISPQILNAADAGTQPVEEDYILKLTQRITCNSVVERPVPVTITIGAGGVTASKIITSTPEIGITGVDIIGSELADNESADGELYTASVQPSNTTHQYTLEWSLSSDMLFVEYVSGTRTWYVYDTHSASTLYCYMSTDGSPDGTNRLHVVSLTETTAPDINVNVNVRVGGNVVATASMAVGLHGQRYAVQGYDPEKPNYNKPLMDIIDADASIVHATQGRLLMEEASAVTSISLAGNTELTDLTQLASFTGLATMPSLAGCTGLRSLAIPRNVTTIGGNTFADVSLESIVADGNDNFFVEDGILYGKYKRKLIYCVRGKSGKVTLTGSSVCSIYPYAFQGCTGITEILIRMSVDTIGSHAFDGCSHVARYIINNGTMPTLADANAFANDSGCMIYVGLAESADGDNTLLDDYTDDAVWGTLSARLATYRSINAPLVGLTITGTTNVTADTEITCKINPEDCTDEFSIAWTLSAPANTSAREYRTNSSGNKVQCRAAGTTDAWADLCSVTGVTQVTTDSDGKKVSVNTLRLGSVFLSDEQVTVTARTIDNDAIDMSASKTVTLYQQYAVQSFDKDYPNYNPAVMIILHSAGKVNSANVVNNADGSKGMYVTKSEAASMNNVLTTSAAFYQKTTMTDSNSIVAESYTNGVAVVTKKYDFEYFDELKNFANWRFDDLGGWQSGFRGCTKLRHVTFSTEQRTGRLGNINKSNSQTGLFCDCSSLVMLPEEFDGFDTLGAATFANCTSLTWNHLPSTIKTLITDSYAGMVSPIFNGCIGISSFTINNDVVFLTSVNNNTTVCVFTNCSNLSEIHYHGTLAQWLEKNPLYGSTGLKNGYKIFLLDDNGDEYLLQGNLNINQVYPRLQFIDYAHITSVAFGAGITSIPDYAFAGCSMLTSVSAAAVSSVGISAFEGAGITSFDFSNIETLGRYAFFNSKLAGDVTLPSISGVLEGVFAKTEITKLIIPSSQNATIFSDYDIRPYSMNNSYGLCSSCSKLTEVYLGTNTYFAGGDGSDSNIGINFDIREPQSGCFCNCTSLTRVTINPDAGCLTPYMFYGCSMLVGINRLLKSINGLTTIPKDCFNGCTSCEKNLVIPANITTIEAGAFDNCGIKCVDFEEGSVITQMAPIANVITIQTDNLITFGTGHMKNVSRLDANDSLGIISGGLIKYTSAYPLLVSRNVTDVSVALDINLGAIYGFRDRFLILRGDMTSFSASDDYNVIYGAKMLLTCKTPMPVTFTNVGANMHKISFYVGDVSDQSNDTAIVNAYKAASGWSSYADKIFSLYDYAHTLFTISLIVNSSTRGTVEAIGGITTGYFEQTVKVCAFPKSGFKFVYWDYGTHPNHSTQSLTIYQNQKVKAYFEVAKETDPVVNVNVAGSGSVKGGGAYEPYSLVTLYATANAGAAFTNWTDGNGAVLGTDAEYGLFVEDTGVTINANFSTISE